MLALAPDVPGPGSFREVVACFQGKSYHRLGVAAAIQAYF